MRSKPATTSSGGEKETRAVVSANPGGGDNNDSGRHDHRRQQQQPQQAQPRARSSASPPASRAPLAPLARVVTYAGDDDVRPTRESSEGRERGGADGGDHTAGSDTAADPAGVKKRDSGSPVPRDGDNKDSTVFVAIASDGGKDGGRPFPSPPSPSVRTDSGGGGGGGDSDGDAPAQQQRRREGERVASPEGRKSVVESMFAKE